MRPTLNLVGDEPSTAVIRFRAACAAVIAACAVASASAAQTILIDFAGNTYGPPILPDGVGAEPTGLPFYNVYDPPATQADGTFRFTTASAGFPLGVAVNMIADLKDSAGVSTGVSLQGIRNGGSAGIARDKYSGPAFAGFATEALQDMIFSNSNISDALVFVLDGLPTDETAAYTLALASARDVGTFGPGYLASFRVGGVTQTIDAIASPGAAVFDLVLPDANGQIRVAFGDPAPTAFAAYFNALKIEKTTFVPGDADLDGLVDTDDLDLMAAHFFSSVPVRQNGDLNFDGFVDYEDFGRWFSIYNAPPGGSAAGIADVPEPGTAIILLMGTAVATLAWRKRLSRAFTAICASGCLIGSTSAGAELPSFQRQGLVINPVPLTAPPLSYPHDDAIFSSVIDATDHFANPLAKYYLYFGPHDSPGGIFMAYSNSLDGPWTLYDSNPADAKLNPVISNAWAGNYSVSHVASAHALWIPEVEKTYLWFHGENNQTRYASTTDGLNFQYEGIAVDTSRFNGTSEASYARVFRSAVPEKDAQYVLMLMGNQSGTRPLYLAWSNDARNWTTMGDPLITPHGNPAADPQISSPHLFEWGGQKYVVYHQNFSAANPPPGDVWATPITNNFEVAGPPQLFFAALPTEDLNHVWAPSFIRQDDTMYMFYDSGSRLHSWMRNASTPIPQTESETLSLNGVPRFASSVLSGPQPYAAGNVVDGDPATRWAANAADNQWLFIDLGENRLIEQLKIDWTSNNARDYSILVSSSAVAPNPVTQLGQWDMIAKITGRNALAIGGDADGLDGHGGGNADDVFDFVNGKFIDLDGAGLTRALVTGNETSILGRYLMVYANTRTTAGGPSIWELEVKHSVAAPPPQGVWLRIDRATGQAAIVNTGSVAVDVIGYTISSDAGALDVADWISLQDQARTDWREANPTSYAVTELKATPSEHLDPAAILYFGRPHSSPPIPFGTPHSDDISFKYYTSGGQLISGVVEYVGEEILNNLVLQVDPASGEARLENNSPRHISLAAYEVASLSESLNHAGWNSLADQALENWSEANSQSTRVAESTTSGTALSMGDSLTLGNLFAAGNGVRDLAFTFRLQSEVDFRTGIVRYGSPGGLTTIVLEGDYNRDGFVDAADYVVWRSTVGQTGFGLAADGNGDGIVNPTDYSFWRARFGGSVAGLQSAAATAVPEPATSSLVVVAALALYCKHQRIVQTSGRAASKRTNTVAANQLSRQPLHLVALSAAVVNSLEQHLGGDEA